MKLYSAIPLGELQIAAADIHPLESAETRVSALNGIRRDHSCSHSVIQLLNWDIPSVPPRAVARLNMVIACRIFCTSHRRIPTYSNERVEKACRSNDTLNAPLLPVNGTGWSQLSGWGHLARRRDFSQQAQPIACLDGANETKCGGGWPAPSRIWDTHDARFHAHTPCHHFNRQASRYTTGQLLTLGKGRT